MLSNRSCPSTTVIPEVPYADVGAAAQWLCEVFGFTLRILIANYRAQLNVGDGAMIVTEMGDSPSRSTVMVRVEDVDPITSARANTVRAFFDRLSPTPWKIWEDITGASRSPLRTSTQSSGEGNPVNSTIFRNE